LEIFRQTEDVFHFSLEGWRFHFDERAREESKQPTLMVGEVEGKIIGDWYLEPTTFSGDSGVFFISVEVDLAEQHKGYGTALWNDLESTLIKRGARRVYDNIRADFEHSHRFAAARGFARNGRGTRMSRLVLEKANLDGYDGVEEKVAALGVTIVPITEIDTTDETFLRDMYEASTSMVEDIPRTEAEWNPDSFETWRQNFLKTPEIIPEAYFVAMQKGKPVGLANLLRNGEDGVSNGLTGVVRSARHQGIARALKYKTITWAKEHGMKDIVTANDAANAPMLSINIPLGYEAVPEMQEWVKNYEQ
jgi:GNAT superfamily N-acetyltransferase